MAYVVAEPCIKCNLTDCVAVCPVDAFREGENFLAIDPEECIDCGACVPECPVEAIFEEDDVPGKWSSTSSSTRISPLNGRSLTTQRTRSQRRRTADVEKKRAMLSEAPAS